MSVSAVIGQVRARLGDEAKHRWTDARMLYLAQQAQLTLCALTGIIRKEVYLPLYPGRLRYLLPSDCLKLTRVEYKGNPVDIITRDDIDSVASLPNALYVVKTHLDINQLEIYPKVPDSESTAASYKEGETINSTIQILPMFGVVTYVDAPMVLDGPFGELTSGIYDRSTLSSSTSRGSICDSSEFEETQIGFTGSIYGCITDAMVSYDQSKVGIVSEISNGTLSSAFGIITDVAYIDEVIKVYYEAAPMQELQLTSELVIPEIWTDSIIDYVTGYALQDDNDASNVARGEQMISKFTQKALKAREIASKQYASSKTQLKTTFRRI